MNTSIDVREFLSKIRVPTLVMHRRDDRDAGMEEGRYIADRIPGAQFVELDGEDHLLFAGDVQPVLRCTEDFVRNLPTGDGAGTHNTRLAAAHSDFR